MLSNMRWLFFACLSLNSALVAAQDRTPQPPPEFASTEISPTREMTFRVFAPKASSVRLSASDLPGLPQAGLEMKKSDDGVWSATTPTVPGGAYRYQFSIDGVNVLDPRNPNTSASNMNAWSLVIVPGAAYMSDTPVPHGAVASVIYPSKTLGRERRAHVYTPPQYDAGGDYPVLYLLHGAFDSDHSWSSVGQAGLILDQLIASGKAKPMIVVMPMGHTGPFAFGRGGNFEQQMQDFVNDFKSDLRPWIERRYRVIPNREHRAIAGLSMGGAQTLSIAMGQPQDYSAVGVFSSGVFGLDRGANEGPGAAWIASHSTGLNDAKGREGLKLLWFATGKDDFLLNTTKASVKLFEDKGFKPEYAETEGGHTWLVWRDYLHQFAQRLF